MSLAGLYNVFVVRSLVPTLWFSIRSNILLEFHNILRLLYSCVAMLADLYHAEGVCGTGTVGSSEAILLAGLAMKRRWSEKRKAAGKPLAQPNMVCGSEVHVSVSRINNLPALYRPGKEFQN
jgi:glutamate/tyrosine decarboxylase-like PLP-dependent enzyme